MASTDKPKYQIAVWTDGKWCWKDHIPTKRVLFGDEYELIDVPMGFTDPDVEAFLRYRSVAESVIPEEKHDPVQHPSHYTSHPSGVECLDITKHLSFCIGNAIKYIWRHKDKGRPVEDLRKAIFYLEEQIKLYECAD